MVKLLPKLLILICLFFFVSPTSLAQGDLMIMPKRIVFDGSQRSHEINLANTGTDTATYAISFIQYKMTDEGKFEEVIEPENGQRFATDFLRYYPRRVSLAPNEAQTVRVQLTKTGDLEPGEYRSHVYFRAVEDESALGLGDQQESKGISIQIKTVFGISIPVIIRHGESTTELQIEDLQLNFENGNPKISMSLHRSGNMSVYGDVLVEHISVDGVSTQVGMVKGISVYTPNLKRKFSFALQVPEGRTIDLQSGKLKVKYLTENNKEAASTEINLD